MSQSDPKRGSTLSCLVMVAVLVLVIVAVRWALTVPV